MMRIYFQTLLMAFAASAVASEQPNVLLIMADDLGYSDVGAMGGEIPTPNIDRLAKGGVRFTQCYNSSRCCPSRASLMTGLYPHQAGIGSFARATPERKKGPAYLGHLNSKCVTLAEVLGDAGYQTYMVGKWHMEEPGPVARGFDEFYGFVHGYEQNQWDPKRYKRLPQDRTPEITFSTGDGGEDFYATDAFTDYSLEFLKQARKKNSQGDPKPWFLYLAHSSPHFPVQAPKETVDKFVDIYRRGWDELRKERFERMKQSGLADETWTFTERSLVPVDRSDIANNYPGQQNPAWDDLAADRREDLARRMAIVAAMVSHVDQGIGRILADLESNGELDNTVIVFLSDNGACYEWGPFGFDGPSRRGATTLHKGEALANMGGPGTYHSYGSGWANLGNTPFRLYKHFTHEGGNCTPMFVHWPAKIKQSDRWVRDPVHVMDLMPTLCEASGADYPADFKGKSIQPTEGESLLPVLEGESLTDRLIASEHNGSRSLRRGDWKVVWPVRMPWESKWELYNLADDRCEANDLASERPELVQELAGEWMAWAERVKVYPFFKQPATAEVLSPEIDRRPLNISAQVSLRSKRVTGVILAQGGREQGYALHVEKDGLVFSVRNDGEVTSTSAYPVPSKAFRVEATLGKQGEMQLRVNGKSVATAQAPGLLPAQPSDPLSIGYDELSAVGDYRSPATLKGEVVDVRVNGVAVRPTVRTAAK